MLHVRCDAGEVPAGRPAARQRRRGRTGGDSATASEAARDAVTRVTITMVADSFEDAVELVAGFRVDAPVAVLACGTIVRGVVTAVQTWQDQPPPRERTPKNRSSKRWTAAQHATHSRRMREVWAERKERGEW